MPPASPPAATSALPADTATDVALVRRAAAGDPAAREEIVSAHYARLYRYLLGFTRHGADAENLTHETFLAAFDKLPRLELRAPLASWLFGIACHLYFRSVRESRKWETEPLSDDLLAGEPSPAEELEMNDTLQKVNEIARRELAARDYAVFRHAYFERLSPTEMAEVMGGTALAARVALCRVRRWIDELRKTL